MKKSSSFFPIARKIGDHKLSHEGQIIRDFMANNTWEKDARTTIQSIAYDITAKTRKVKSKKISIEHFLSEYGLSTQEGVILMCLAESLLRIPDAQTQDDLIRDKLGDIDLKDHVRKNDHFLINASTWALMLSGSFIKNTKKTQDGLWQTAKNLFKRSGEPVLRHAVLQAMHYLSHYFVIGETIDASMKQAKSDIEKGFTHSFDMLGEQAMTYDDADKYFAAYRDALLNIHAHQSLWTDGNNKGNTILSQPSLSIKLSALHPRYEATKKNLVITELVPKLIELLDLAIEKNVPITIDAEETDRLELSLDIFARLYDHAIHKGWGGLGLAVQAYQKRAIYVLQWLYELHQHTIDAHKESLGQKADLLRLPIRLVKGAYWDSEIKWAQEQGLESYPVFTRKIHTDISYLHAAKFLCDHRDVFYPQFATHNAHTIAAIMHLVQSNTQQHHGFEFQRLHGMGEVLYDVVMKKYDTVSCRVYAPVGRYQELLPYLVRRLLENGANTSFVHQLSEPDCAIEDLIQSPFEKVSTLKRRTCDDIFLQASHPDICLPDAIFNDHQQNGYAHKRMNSKGADFSDAHTQKTWEDAAASTLTITNQHPIKTDINEDISDDDDAPHDDTPSMLTSSNPLQPAHILARVPHDDISSIDAKLDLLNKGFDAWRKRPVAERAHLVETLGALLDERRMEFVPFLVQEAGKSLPDCMNEIREAVDFCYYYAEQAKKLQGEFEFLQGYTGEHNHLFHVPRGIMLCISPWNFPLAIFLGQIVANLVVGNVVVAKPAEQTPLIAQKMVELMMDAGIPKDVIQLCQGMGETVGARLVDDPRTQGVVFTGSVEVARIIQKQLALQHDTIKPLIAETGGLNAMFVDSSALLEQVTHDIMTSSFQSAGQRCSALRLLIVQDDIADDLMRMLKGAMDCFTLGNPGIISNDMGPVIDEQAAKHIHDYIENRKLQKCAIYQPETAVKISKENPQFIPPTLIELGDMDDLKQEIFGPVLHVVRFSPDQLDIMIHKLNAKHFGLTLGVQSRIQSFIDHVIHSVNVGNVYVNRNIIGAIVGLQPFGGVGLSGTGPKAGGPNYLKRLCTEKAISNNVTAMGGNTELLMIGDG